MSIGADVLFTYGVVERICSIASSDNVFKRFEASHYDPRDLQSILLDQSVVFQRIYKHINECDNFSSQTNRNRLSHIKGTAYDIEDMLDVAATDQKINGRHDTFPSDQLVNLCVQLTREISELDASCSEVGRSHAKSVYSGMLNLIFKPKSKADPKERIADTRFVPQALFSLKAGTTKATDAYSNKIRVLSCVWEDTVVGRESVKKEIMNWVFHPSNQLGHPKVVSVSGDNGIGKTTLAKLIYTDALVSTTFDLLLWATNSTSKQLSLDLKSTLVEIIRSVTSRSSLYLQRMDTETLKDILRGFLKGQKYLLVLDDISKNIQPDEWEKLRETLKVGSQGSTVIVTLSGSSVPGSFKCNTILQGLPENDCWSLFSRCAGLDEEHPLNPIGKTIVNKCRQCPLAIKTMGMTLRATRDEHQWKQIDASRIWTSYPFNAASQSLMISFEQLSSCELIQCFLRSAILLENNVMSREQLIYSWMAQELLRQREENEDYIDTADRYLNELLSKDFLQLHPIDGHDIILVHKQAQDLVQYLLVYKVGVLPYPMEQDEVVQLRHEYFEESCSHLSWNGDHSSLDNGFAPDHLTLPKVRTFFFQKYVGPVNHLFLEELISKLGHARILLLDGSVFEELPQTIGDLKLLRYLSLAGNHKLQVIPESICNLLNLQTLDLSGCEQLQTLPKYMHSLASLKHLFLSVKLTHIPEEALESWKSLRHLKICNSPNLNLISEGIQHCTALQVLQIHDCPMIASLPNNIKHLGCLKELSIMKCEMLNLAYWNGLYGLRALQFIQFWELPKLIKFPGGLYSAADSLQRLVVSNCEILTALPECLHMCRYLLEIVIDNCPNMATLPKGIQAIKTLQALKIVNSPKLMSRCQSGTGEDWHLISHVPNTQLQIQKRATLTLKEHPEKMSIVNIDELSDAKQWTEDKGKEYECPRDGTSIQDELQSSPIRKDEETVLEASLVQEMKDYCSILFLLPENYEIEEDTLIQLWMAGDYIKYEPIELQGKECFSFVLNNGYLLCSGTNFMTGKDKYRINIKKINELLDGQKDMDSFYLKWENGKPKNSRPADSIQHVSLVCDDIDGTVFQKLQKFNTLRSLLFLGNYGHRVKEIPHKFFSSFENLLALDLSRTHIRELPSSVGNMIHLRYLDLSWTLIEWVPEIICSLVELQTMKLRGCSNLRELPRQLKRLTKLRHLDVDVLRQFEAVPKGIGALVNLRTLSAFLVGNECKINELKDLNNLSGNFCIAKLEQVKNAYEAREAALYKKRQLEKLELRWTASELSGAHSNSDAILERLQPCTSLEELQILCYEGLTFPSWISNPIFNKIIRITFYRCENVSELPLIEQLPCLKHLDLIKMNSVRKIECRGKLKMGAAFPKLEKLEINEMQNLKVWEWKKRNEGDFVSLTRLIINDCPELEEFDVLPYLSSIKHFEIRECPKLQSLPEMKLSDSLEELIVEDCPHIHEVLRPGRDRVV